jgi:hypothetical protein
MITKLLCDCTLWKRKKFVEDSNLIVENCVAFWTWGSSCSSATGIRDYLLAMKLFLAVSFLSILLCLSRFLGKPMEQIIVWKQGPVGTVYTSGSSLNNEVMIRFLGFEIYTCFWDREACSRGWNVMLSEVALTWNCILMTVARKKKLGSSPHKDVDKFVGTSHKSLPKDYRIPVPGPPKNLLSSPPGITYMLSDDSSGSSPSQCQTLSGLGSTPGSSKVPRKSKLMFRSARWKVLNQQVI